MDLLLKDKIILVTGGSKGLGFACAKLLVEEGAKVIIASRSESNLRIASEKIKKDTGYDIDCYSVDISKEESVINMKNELLSKFNNLDGLIINSGGPPTGMSLDFSEKEWLSAINSNFLSVVRLCKAFVPIMKEKKFGRIVAITSMSAKQPLPNLVLSNSTRLGVAGFLKTLSNEVGRHNILINTVLPGPTKTERLQSVIEKWAETEGKTIEETIADRSSDIALKRFGEPEEFASLVVYLISGKNSYITGQSIVIDGGNIKSAL